MDIVIATFILGTILGFVGAGGAGVVIALLTVGFGIPIHLALGTSLAAMAFTTCSGAYSHYREGNVYVKLGVVMGLAGAVGAYIGSHIANAIPANFMHYCTGMMLIISAILIYLRVYHPHNGPFATHDREPMAVGTKFYSTAIVAGVICGILSGSFGIGATPFIQLMLLIIFGVPLFIAVGTTMLVILPIAISGGFGYLVAGHLEMLLLVEVLIGLTCGAYVGAKFTRRAPRWFLQFMMVAAPTIGGTILLIK
ncbi:membrane protein [Veillonella montpellierensis DNF00314]|uniref:Probable membrane transporter protein n=1 Tax=Veillonella montpellierensis DNF00314 TaxID=1401067 RepID=A0A096BV45_9FIRM|nr:sulfite exporter TauE/SafE family protein [Veillonella montpellierensis]KGF46612.1 membrane protein [Veillonella montpellierensis DNF00314]